MPRQNAQGLCPSHERAVASLAILAIALFLPGSMRSQSASQSGTAKTDSALRPRDLTGLWFGGVGGGLRVRGKVAAMTPAGQARYDANTAELKTDSTISADPTFRCDPPGVPHIYGVGGYSVEILQVPDRIVLFYESIHTFRTIWMDGRKPPEDADPLWLGFSVGHWDGDDLIVDTTGFNDKTWLNGAGYPHSEALHVTERFHRADVKHMSLDITIDDPKFYAQSWKMGINFTLQPDWQLGESFCIPENQESFKSKVIEENDKDKPQPK